MRKHTRIHRFTLPRCRYRTRHWFTYYNAVGSNAPTCGHCGAPNPYLTDEDLRDFYPDEREKWDAALKAWNITIK